MIALSIAMSEVSRGAPSGSPPRTGRCSPPAASSRRDLGDGAAATTTPAAEPEKEAAAEPSPPGARSHPHLPPTPTPPPPRLLAPSRPRTRSSGRYPRARAPAFLAAAGPPIALRPPPLPNPPAASRPRPDAVVAARHFPGREGRSCPPEGC